MEARLFLLQRVTAMILAPLVVVHLVVILIAVRGGLTAAGSAYLYAQDASLPAMHLGIAAGMGAVLGAVGQIGDLAESLLKREAGIKDSSNILPGHGGILDRFDAVFFTVPMFYGMVQLWLML